MTKSKYTRYTQIVGLALYIICLMLPIYWLLNMSFKENQEILGKPKLLARKLDI